MPVTRYNRVVSDPCSCKNNGVSDIPGKSFIPVSPGQDGNFPADRYDQASDSYLVNNILNGTWILCPAKKCNHLGQGKHGCEEICRTGFDVILYFRDMAMIIFNSYPGINEVPDRDPPPLVQRIRSRAVFQMMTVVSSAFP